MKHNILKPNLLLIHGAFHGPWCWKQLTPLLSQTYNCISIKLPQQKTSAPTISLSDYINTCALVIQQYPKCAILAHSMAGIILSALCEQFQNKISHAIYLASILVDNNRSWSDYRQKNIMSQLTEGLDTQKSNTKELYLNIHKVKSIFYNMCSTQDVEFAKKNLSPQNISPLKEKLCLGSNYQLVKKYYIMCRNDHALDPNLQLSMKSHQDITQSFSMDTDHSPFFSNPVHLAEIIQQII